MSRIVLPANFEPRQYQKDIMAFFDRGGKRAWWCVHRRGGKDRTMLAQISKMAHKRVGLYLHCLPTLNQARRAVWDAITGDGLPLIDSTFPQAIVESKNEAEMRIKLRCGSIVQLVGADNFDRNVGTNPVHITFSEYALQDERGWHLLRPILTENNGTAAFISTPRGRNHFYELGEAAKRDPDRWYAEKMDILRTGRMTPEDVQREIEEGMPVALARQEYYCDFEAANVGSILGDRIEQADRDGRITEVPYRPGAALDLAFDIGRRDPVAIWVFDRMSDRWVAMVDYFEASGIDAGECLELMAARGWIPEKVRTVWLPHDARARTFATGVSVEERFRSAGYRTIVLPSVSKQHQIEAARRFVSRCVFDADRCKKGLDALRGWSYDYNEDTKVFSLSPRHDQFSHGADAYCYAALTQNLVRSVVNSVDNPSSEPNVGQPYRLDELWHTAARQEKRVPG